MRSPAMLTVLVLLACPASLLAQQEQALPPGPIAGAVPRAAAMLAASASGAATAVSAAAAKENNRTDWRDVLALKPGSPLVVQARGADRVRRFLVDCDMQTLTVSERWGKGPSGPVSVIPRGEIAEVAVLRKHVGQHAGRGTLIGAGVGGLVLGVAAAGDDCEGRDCGGAAAWALVGALVGGLYGSGVGAFVGAVAPRSPDIVYQAPVR